MQPEKLADRELLTEIVKALVEEPGSVVVQERVFPDTGTSHLLIQVSPKDRGKVIGRGGRTAEALRSIFISIAALAGRRVFIEIEEQRGKGTPKKRVAA